MGRPASSLPGHFVCDDCLRPRLRRRLAPAISQPQPALVSETIRLTALSWPSTLHSNTIKSPERSTAAGTSPRDNREKPMSRVTRGLSAALLAAATTFGAYTAQAQDLIVGVSWSNFQEERWKTDEAAIKAELERLGAEYISADAQSSNEKQIADIEGLIARGANALIVLAQDARTEKHTSELQSLMRISYAVFCLKKKKQ